MMLWNSSPDVRDLNRSMNGKPGKVRMNSRGGVFFAVILLFAVGGGISLGYFFNTMAQIKSVDVSGNHFTDSAQILSIAAIPINISPDSISFIETVQRVEKLPYVKEAMLRKRPSGRMEIHVTERQPIGLMINGTIKRYFDEDGVVLPLVTGKTVDVPLVYGLPQRAIADTLKSEAFGDIRDFLILALQDPVAASTISEIAWTRDEGIVALSTENGIRIVFGSLNLAEGIRNWNLFYTQVIAVRGASSFTSIDLRYTDQVVTRES